MNYIITMMLGNNIITKRKAFSFSKVDFDFLIEWQHLLLDYESQIISQFLKHNTAKFRKNYAIDKSINVCQYLKNLVVDRFHIAFIELSETHCQHLFKKKAIIYFRFHVLVVLKINPPFDCFAEKVNFKIITLRFS